MDITWYEIDEFDDWNVDPKGKIALRDDVEPILNSLKQLKAEIAAWVKRWDSASKDPCGLREFPTIDELRQLSAI